MSATLSALRPHKLPLTLSAASAFLLAAVVWGQTQSVADSPQARTVEFTVDDTLKRPPVGYRKWVSIGTPLALHEGEAKAFHAVYMDPEGFAHYEKTGVFRDGTVVVKEAVGVGSTESITGKGYFMGEFTGLQVSVKDSKRFKDEPGNWAYFDFGNKYPLGAEAAKKPIASCNKCHQDNAKTDWVFSQYYPTLRAAAPRSK
jgi:Cytochrome P460